MDPAAPITWFIDRINAMVATGADAAASALATTITPLVSIGFGIHILLVTVNYMRGSESEPVADFMLRCLAFAVVIGLGLNASNYCGVVIPIVTGLGGDLASAVSGGTPAAGSLDLLALHYLSIIERSFEAADGYSFPSNLGSMAVVALKAVLICVGLVPFLISATLAIVIANVGSTVVAMVGPLFFACLLFPATRQYFSAWLNSALSYALFPLLVAVIASISIGLSRQMLSDGGDLSRTTFTDVFLASTGNWVLMQMLNQMKSLASSLSAGGVSVVAPPGASSPARALRDALVATARATKTLGSAAAGSLRMGQGLVSNAMKKAG